MKFIEFTDAGNSINIEWTFDGDYIVSIKVAVFGFSGHANGHVEKNNFESFFAQLAMLNDTRKGAAEFFSAFPGEFEVIVKSVDNLGHLGVFGKLRSDSEGEKSDEQKLEFSMRLEPNQIEIAAKP